MSQQFPAQRTAVAIVGIGCRFPGGVEDPQGFWRLLMDGRDAIGEIPPNRIDLARYYDPKPATPGRIMTRRGGFLDHIEEFDAAFFGISPREAERLDPQHRLLLETAWEALEDAGQDASRLEGTTTGVFVGQWLSDFEGRLFADPEGVDFQMTTGSGRYAASGRISYVLGLRGPSLTLDTACSSSLVAIHLAARSIREGESVVALAGGANVILQPHISVAYSQSRMMAPDGRCKFGDASGDGYVRSEGAAIVVLKALHQAIGDGDRIYAVIRGGAINNDGRSSGSMGTPSRTGQQELLRSAYRDAGIPPSRVGYIEAHGTGTRAGDPVELGALADVLGEDRGNERKVRVGSVKTNIGHTEGAAGVAGLIKAALALHHRVVPASLHCTQPNPAIPWSEIALRIPTQPEPWPGDGTPRVAGISGFGIAGTNAHIVLEEAPQGCDMASLPQGTTPRSMLLPLSARTPEALRTAASRYARWIEEAGDACLPALCWNAATRRTALECRASFAASSAEAMAAELRLHAEADGARSAGNPSPGSPPKIAFVAPGQGAQWLGMARELSDREPVFREALQQCSAAISPYADWSLIEQLQMSPDSPGYRLDRIDVIQPTLVAIAIGYAALWRSVGIRPDAVVGHSMGEVAAACIAGVLDLDQAMRIICRRSALMGCTSGKGAMALVELSTEETHARLLGRESELSLAVSNSPRSSVISGDPKALQEVMALLEADGVFCRLVKVDVASHSPQMEPLAAVLRRELAEVQPRGGDIPIYSTVLARRAQGGEFDATYWASNLRQPVQFTQTVGRMLDDGITVFIELGPHPVLLPSVEQTAQHRQSTMTTIACGRREEPEQASFLAAVGASWAAGAQVDWSKLMSASRERPSLPLYPWQRERHWAEAAEIRPAGVDTRLPRLRRDDESMGWLHSLQWRELEPASTRTASGASPWLLVSQDAADGQSWAAALREAGVAARAIPLDGLGAALAKARADGAGARLLAIASDSDEAASLPVRVIQAVSGVPGIEARVWYLTQGAHSVDPARPVRVSPAQAALWGAARVVAEEHLEFWGGLIDADPLSGPAANAVQLAARLLADDGEDQIAIRGGQIFALRLVPERRDSLAPYRWRADATYLVTGGLGEIALSIAKTMADGGARRLVLMGRTPLPPRGEWSATSPGSVAGRRIAAVRQLEARGVAVHLATVDVGDESQLQAFLDTHRAEAWPPIRGVIHAAGSFHNELSVRMDRAAFDAVVGPKLRGAQLLDRLLPELDLFVLFSSVGAFLAQPGQANYAAANAGLDALALDRHARGLPATSIAWGVWQDTGLVNNEAGARNVAEMARQGIHSFSAEQGARLFAWLCGQPRPQAVVLPIDCGAYRRARQGRVLALMREMPDAGRAPADSAGFAARLGLASPSERRALIEVVVRETVSRVLKIPASRLDARKTLGSLGLNSLLAMELRNRLEAALERSLSATLAWNYPTVEALVAHLAGDDKPPARPAVHAAIELTPEVAGELDAVADLSDDDVALALRRPRSGGRA